MKPKRTLITNINFLQEKSLRLDCKAILIEANAPSAFGESEVTHKIRGFGTSADADVFTQWLQYGSFIIESVNNLVNAIVIGHEGDAKPLFQGSHLRIDGHEYFLQIEDRDFPIDETDVTETDYPEIWEMLARKVEQYWTAPNMPHNSWHRPRKMDSGVSV